MQADSTLKTKINGWKQKAFMVALAAAALSALGFFLDSTAFASSYLVAFLFWLGVTLGCLPLLMIHHLTDGGWGYPIRRLMEMIAGLLPLFMIAFIPVYLLLTTLYPWARPEVVAHDLLIQKKLIYLNPQAFLIRAVIYFALWVLMAQLLIQGARAFSKNFSDKIRASLQRLGGLGLIIYSLTVTFSSIDWAMSLEPHWYSTIYGLLFIIGQTLAGFAVVIILAVVFAKHEPLSKLMTPGRSHDLGKLFFAFVMVWAYLNLSQFIIIWCGNLAEETPWYLKRFSNGWQILSILLPILHFFVPFLMLLSRRRKRNPEALVRIVLLVLVMRWVDLVWMTKPAFFQTLNFHWLDLTCFLALGGIWFFLLAGKISKETLALEHDLVLTGHPEKDSHHG